MTSKVFNSAATAAKKDEPRAYVGIDPGWKNLGISIIDADGEVRSTTFNPSTFKTLYEVLQGVMAFCEPYGIPQGHLSLVIERYVAYEGVHNADSEFILMVTGAIVCEFQRRGFDVRMVRAIEWKPALCKKLYKETGFKNPSPSFDKVYSTAAAKQLAPQFEGTNHEADATCLAFLASYIFA